MKAVILAGGKGTRLAPYTTVFPKPLIPLGHKPILEIIVRQLAHYGFKDITLSVGYLAELIRAYFESANSNPSGVQLRYITEQEPTGTAGSLASVPGLDDTFLVMNGDVLTSINYQNLMEYHHEKGGILTIAMHRREINVDFGVVKMDSDSIITGYEEKPRFNYDVSMGIYVYNKKVLDYIEPDTYLDFPTLVLRLLENNEKVVGYPSSDYWLDIGRHDDYEQAQEEFESMRDLFLPEGTP